MTGLRSLRNRLAVIFGLIVLGAIGDHLPDVVAAAGGAAARPEARAASRPTRGATAPPAAPRVGADAAERAARRAASAPAATRVERRGASCSTPLERQPTGARRSARRTPTPTAASTIDDVRGRRRARGAAPAAGDVDRADADVGRQALVAEPLIQRQAGRRGVAVFADALADVEANVVADPPPDPPLRRRSRS